MSKQESIRDSDWQIELLEDHLKGLCLQALNDNEISAVVDGVFSLDQLESLMESDLNGSIGVGIGYQGCQPVGESRGNPVPDPHVSLMNQMLFMVLLAVPVDAVVSQRLSATRLLTVLRKGILGKQVDIGKNGRGTQRPWEFVQEKPEIDESTKTMLYYTQVWRLSMPLVAK